MTFAIVKYSYVSIAYYCKCNSYKDVCYFRCLSVCLFVFALVRLLFFLFYLFIYLFVFYFIFSYNNWQVWQWILVMFINFYLMQSYVVSAVSYMTLAQHCVIDWGIQGGMQSNTKMFIWKCKCQCHIGDSADHVTLHQVKIYEHDKDPLPNLSIIIRKNKIKDK
jgi:hypothetical protein